jgi:hypothetical protein
MYGRLEFRPQRQQLLGPIVAMGINHVLTKFLVQL